ncbi:molybdopterin-dependent oxidoreductase [Desulfonema magnum]|uniref:Methylenetetrahydrofolate reductase domain-containing protein n=1 Tax=Desulfonema magnum TaxID=45655 RepID=A0A975BXD9_9BACT|nr:molybdopterin-dependent oxidoreductase [Desulfonema magnum]QTA93473.1 Methylenetetrahydrofolate reductase domain-containing protein [Desulfonema magnum]
METIALIIDNKKISCPPGTSILEAAQQNGIKIPTLCYHPDLKPFGACRLCLVEDENTGRLMASCVTPVAPNMSIRTDSPDIKRHRRNIVRLMMAEHPESCIVCNKGNRCQLRAIAAQLGIGETKLYSMPNYKPLEQANEFIVRDLSKCILCGKCIRADHELVVVGAIDYNHRGFISRPATVHEQPLEKSNCIFCGTCVSLCPTGALSPKTEYYVGTPERESRSVCGFCGVGCSVTMGVVGDQIAEVSPSHVRTSVNGSTLCVRGHFPHEFLKAERLTQPLLRKDGEPAPASWEESLEIVSTRILDIRKQYGPQSVAFIGSSECNNEEAYLFQKIARVLVETNNVDNPRAAYTQAVLRRIDEKTNGRCRKNPLARLENGDAVFILNADPGEMNTVASFYLKRGSRKGVSLVMANPVRTELTAFSSAFLEIRPQSEFELIKGIGALLYEEQATENGCASPEMQQRSLFSDTDLDKVCQAAGVNMDSLKQAANVLRGKKVSVVTGDEIMLAENGAETVNALLELMAMTQSLGKEDTGFYVLAKACNETGAYDMGLLPDALPGRQLLSDDSARKHWEDTWKVRLSPDQGLSAVRMIEEAEKGNLKALYILRENPFEILPDPDRVRKALENLDFMVVQDIFPGELTEMADVVLPGAAFFEKGGSFTNMEGRIQVFEPVVSPPGEARQDWEILGHLTAKLGHSEPYDSVEKIKQEIARVIPMYSEDGRTYGDWIR